MSKKKKGFFEEYDYASKESCTPTCSHFGSCGGCSLQNISYGSQVVIKEEYLNNLFSREVLVLANDDPFHYRDRMDFVYQNGSLGLRKKGDFKTVIPIDTCHLIPREFQDSFTKVQNLLKKYQFPHYDIQDHTGFLRYIVFRYAESTNQLMLIITTANPVDDQEEKLNAFIKELSARSIYWLVSDSITDVSIPVVSPRLIQGEKTIQEKIGNYLFHISPYSFFQANVKMAARIFEEIKEEVRGPTVDLCCGVGSIGLFVSEKATSITGIEEVAPAIDLAKQNKELNRNTNATFFASDMKNILDFTPLDVQTLIVDPPRAGLGKKVVKRIKELAPEKIIYMSCNPKTQKLDFDMLEGYGLISLKGYDMFPQTPHVETLAILERKE